MQALLAAQDPPAGGAAADQVIVATGFGVVATAVLLYLCVGHRSGRVGLLSWGAGLSERLTGMIGWAILPSTIGVATLLPALFGLQWDESLHIAQGRDEGPLANPSHYFLLVGIFAGFAAGVISMTLGDDRVPRSGIKIRGTWRAPLGGVLMAAGSAVALLGFPLDDVWHRFFGQDVTLWSATHVTMIGGMSLAVLGTLILNIEGMRAGASARAERSPNGTPRRSPSTIQALLRGSVRLIQWLLMPGALLAVVSLLQGEFDYGVPQFREVFHPMVVMGAAGVALVAARIFMGRGAALGGAVTFLAVRGVIALLVGPVLGEPDHMFPLYLAEAAVVELVALRVRPSEGALRFGLCCGALIGTAGLAAEWAWSAVYAIPWPESILPETILLGGGMAVAGSVLGAWIGVHLTVERSPRTTALRSGAILSCVAITVMIGYGLIKPSLPPATATVTLREVHPGPDRTVQATVRFHPPGAAENADLLRTIAWQGGGFATHPLKKVGPGVYRTTEPVPVHGSWKTGIRLQRDGAMSSVTLYLPKDDAIPLPEVPASPRFTRPLQGEGRILRREAKDVPGWIWTASTGAVAVGMMALLYGWALGLRRLADAAPEPPARRRPPAPAGEPAPARVEVPA